MSASGLIDTDRRQQICDFLGNAGLSLQLRLDILDVSARLRPAARVLIRPEGEAKEVCASLLGLGLSISVGKGVKWQPKTAATTCHDWFSETLDQSALEPMVPIYVAFTEVGAVAARAADETADDGVFATALGYPACCIRWVLARGRVPEVRESISLYAPNGKYDPLIWPGAMIVDAPLTAHYPCSTSCKPSRDVAQARISLLLQVGQDDILRHLADARELVYFLDANCALKAAPSSGLEENQNGKFASPSMPSRQALGLP